MTASQFLGLHTFGGGLLCMPGLQQLFGQSLQLRGINSGINRPGKAFYLKLLTNCEFLRARHHGTNEQRVNIIGGLLLLCGLNYA